jgi:hypothetical protein
MSEIRLFFYSPGLSKATLAEILAPVGMSGENISVDVRTEDSALNSDPATVALIGAAGVTVAALIQAAVDVYLYKKRERKQKKTGQTNCSVLVKVFGTLGESWVFEVNDTKQIEIQFGKLPSDPNEISRIRLE